MLESKRKECDPPCSDANVSSPYHNPRTKASSYRTVNVSKFHSASPHNRSTPKNKSDTPVNIIVEGQRKRANVLEHIYQGINNKSHFCKYSEYSVVRGKISVETEKVHLIFQN